MDANAISPGTPVLVTGATGFTGNVLTKKLVTAGLKVNAIARRSSQLGELEALPIRWVRGDVFDPQVIKAAMKDVEYVFHLAAAYREARYNDDYYHLVHVESTRLLAHAAIEQPKFRRFVHTSTIGVHGHISRPPADEEYPFSPGDVYQKTKAEAELWIREFASADGLALTVIRPAAIYGPQDRRLLKLFRMATHRFFPVLGRGKCLYHLIHVEDLTDAMILAATHPEALGEVFICGNDDPVSIMKIGEIVAATYGKRFRVVRLPVSPFFIAGAICEATCKPLGLEPPLHRRRVAFYTKDRAFDTSKIRERLGFRCQHSNEEGIRQTAEAYLRQNWVHL